MKSAVVFGAFLPVIVVLGGFWVLSMSVLYVQEEILV